MKLAGLFTRLLAFAVILSIAGLAGLGFNAFRHDLDALRASSKENILWSAAQLEFELSRFTGALGAFGAGFPGVDAAAVNKRFDVLWSRVNLLHSGDAGSRLTVYDSGSRPVAALFADMEAVEKQVVGLKDGDRYTAVLLAGRFKEHSAGLRQLVLDVLHGEEKKASQNRDKVRVSAQMTALLSLAAVVLSILGMIVFSAETRRFRRLAAANLRLAEEAEQASLAKSRFLTMMSHELRTPMNGVLGLLALARQTGLPKPQLRLVEQAERSGREMMDMLADMLDFSAMQDEALELDRKPFRPADLCRAVQAQFDPLARREGTSLALAPQGDETLRVTGDFQRLRQALSHLAAYVGSTAGVRDIELSVSHDAGSLRLVLSFLYGEGGAAWRPELILGAPDRERSQFASDALGPAIARQLIGRMGGSIALDQTAAGRIAVVIGVPADRVETVPLVVHVAARSGAVRTLAEAAIRAPGVTVLRDDDPGQAALVLMEAGGEAEAADAARLRVRFPAATLIGLGRPLHPGLFDSLADLPADIPTLRRSVSDRLAS